MAELRRSAAYRIAFTYSIAFALAVALLGAAAYLAADAAFRRQQDSALVEESAELVRDYRGEGLAELTAAIAARGSGGRITSFGYAMFDARGRRMVGNLDLPRPRPGFRAVDFRDPVEGADAARALTTTLDDGHTLVVAIDSEALERIDRTLLTLFGGAFVLVLMIGAGGALILGRYLQQRLARISGTANAIVAGSINVMLDRIADLVDDLRQVSSDIAHDLRTPLARLRGGLEAALDAPADAERHRVALRNAVQQSDALLSLFGGILRIAEVGSGGITEGFRTVDLTALASDLCESYAPAVADGGRTLACPLSAAVPAAVPAAMRVLGDRELIAQAVTNLLDNAQSHTPRGTAIRLDLAADDALVRLTVADSGPGVPAADRERIVRRFVRLDPSRSTPGHGLGLNLAAAIATAHGGTLVFDDNRPGLRATLVLPRLAA